MLKEKTSEHRVIRKGSSYWVPSKSGGRTLVASFDAVGTILSCIAAWLVWTRILDREFFWWHGILLGIIGMSWIISLAGSRVLNGRLRRSLMDDLPLILNRVLLASIIIALGVTVVSLNPDQGSLALVAATLVTVVLPTSRGLAYATLAHRRSSVNQRILIVGAGTIGARVAHLLSRSYQPGVEVVGFLDKEPMPRSQEEDESGLPILGSSYDLGQVIQEHRINKVVIAFSTAPHQRILEMVWECDRHGVDISIIPRFFEATTVHSSVENVAGIPLMHLYRARLIGYNALLKRTFDILAAATGLLVMWPVLLAIALAIKLDSSGPVIFSQSRAGHDGQYFTMYKFRSMKVGSQNTSNYTIFGDPRRTRVGKYLRTFSLDELPQLINVLKGDMSLVGPRPEVWDRSQELAHTVYRYYHRYRVKSGITGWSQVNGLRGDTSIAERVVFDNYYIENWSLWLDIKIIILTLFKAWLSKPERVLETSKVRAS